MQKNVMGNLQIPSEESGELPGAALDVREKVKTFPDQPGVYIMKDAAGTVTTWKFEGYPPVVLSRIGWKREVTMKVGDTVTVFAWRARDGSNQGHSRQVTFADGKKLYSGPPAGTGDGGSTPPVAVVQQ